MVATDSLFQADFRGTAAKAQQALARRIELRKYIEQEFDAESKQPRIGIKFDDDQNEHVLYVSHFTGGEQHLLHISNLLGDIVYNLRASLDQLTFQLALRNNNGQLDNPRRVQFPIEESLERFQARCTSKGADGWIADLDPADQAIIQEIQPFGIYQERIYLRLLRLLNDQDKHRSMISLSARGEIIGDDRVRAIITAATNAEPPVDIRLGTDLFRAVIPDMPKTSVEGAGYVHPIPVFSVAPDFEVLPSVRYMVEVVFKILGKFNAA